MFGPEEAHRTDPVPNERVNRMLKVPSHRRWVHEEPNGRGSKVAQLASVMDEAVESGADPVQVGHALLVVVVILILGSSAPSEAAQSCYGGRLGLFHSAWTRHLLPVVIPFGIFGVGVGHAL